MQIMHFFGAIWNKFALNFELIYTETAISYRAISDEFIE